MDLKHLLWGLAIGDAFGAGIEFQDREWIRENIDFSEFVNRREGAYAENYRPWDYTDDTEMTIGVMEALMSGRELTPDLLVEYWKKEYEADKEEKGFGRQGHGSMRWYYNGERSIGSIREFQRNRESPGNAPPMRAVPFGLVRPNLIDRYAVINADATHPHPRARAASIIVARATEYLLVKNGEAANMVPHIAGHVRGMDQETDRLLERVPALPGPEQLEKEHWEVLCGPQPLVKPSFPEGINGLPCDAMYTGISVAYVLMHARDAMDALRISIRFGGDVDSLASICTAIMAGKHGIGSLPAFMLENVEGKEKLAKIASRFSQIEDQR